jgi:hypothetical protein
MAKSPPPSVTRPGDLVVVEGHRVGEGRRIGEILEVLGTPGHVHYRVRWDDDHESVFYPSSDAIIQHTKRTRGAAAGSRTR